MKRVLCIWLPEWPIQRLIVAQPELRTKPIVLHARDARRGRRVVMCCDQARRWGVRAEMPLAEVAALVNHANAATSNHGSNQPLRQTAGRTGRTTGPQVAQTATQATTTQTRQRAARPPAAQQRAIHLRECDPEADLASFKQLALWCEQFSPIVGLEDTDFPSSLLLDITGLEPIFGSEATLLQTATEAFHNAGYQISLAAAQTVGAAWALAHFQHHDDAQYDDAQYDDDQHDDGQYDDDQHDDDQHDDDQHDDDQHDDDQHAPLQQAAATHDASDVPTEHNETNSAETNSADTPRLARLPVEALRLPADCLQTLRQLGVETIAQLLQLPRAGLATRLGGLLVKRIDQAKGQSPEVIVAHRPAPTFEATWDLEHPTDRRNAIEEILQQLTERVAQTLAQHDHALIQAEAILEGKTDTKRLLISLFQPSHNPRHLFELFLLQLETAQMRQPIHRVRVTAITHVRIKGEQHGLWDDLDLHGKQEIGLLVDRLSSRLGKECVFGVQAQAGALPERAYRRKPLADTLHKGRRRAATTANSLKSPHRPLWLQQPPLPLQMIAVASHPHSSPPGHFQFQNRSHTVAQHWGPERIETGWWQGRTIRRDYYRIETREGYRFWIFRSLSNGEWFLHGCFE